MSTQPERLRYLLRQYIDDSCSKEELTELYAAVGASEDLTGSSLEYKALADLLDEEFGKTQPGAGVQDVDWDHMFDGIVKKPASEAYISSIGKINKYSGRINKYSGKISKYSGKIRRYSGRYTAVAAAAVMLLLIIAGGFYRHTHNKTSVISQDIMPGSNKAMLTLADGSTITLDSAGNRLIQQGKTAIQQQGGRLQYNAQNTGNQRTDNLNTGNQNGGNQNTNNLNINAQHSGSISYNTLSTPRGGQFCITLPDGTKVWLNAASSLKYPIAFTGTQREVTLTGEAYFEVVHNDNMPFLVHAAGMDIKDIGTHFNIMAYNDEVAVKTTLIEGAVNISDGKKTHLLKPGQQAIGMNIQEADVDAAIAWKNGEFSFHHTSIYEIMRQLSRWYDVDINYKDSLNIYLSGNITKNVSVSEVFKMLELAGDVTFKIENRKATVMKQ